MKIIGFGELSWDLLYFPGMIIASGIKYLLLKQIITNSDLHTTTLSFFSLFSESFGGLGAIYYYCLTLYKAKRKDKIKKRKEILLKKKYFKLIPSKALKKKSIIILFMFALTFCNVIVVSLLCYLVCVYSRKGVNLILDYKFINVQIIFLIVLTYLVLNQTFYKHQWFSLVLIIIGICLILFPNIVNEVDLQFRIPLVIFAYLLASIKSVCEKYIMEVRYITSHQFALFDGLVGAILCILLTYLLQFILPETLIDSIGRINIVIQEIIQLFHNSVIYFFLTIVVMACYALIVKQTRYYFTPMHCTISESFSVFLLWVLLTLQYKLTILEIVLSVLGFVFLIFGNLIYNEIIIIYVFNLHYNTRLIVQNRGDTFFLQSELNGFDYDQLTEEKTIENTNTQNF